MDNENKPVRVPYNEFQYTLDIMSGIAEFAHGHGEEPDAAIKAMAENMIALIGVVSFNAPLPGKD